MPAPTIKPPGLTLAPALTAKGLNPKAVARYLGITPAAFSNITRGHTRISTAYALKIEELLGLSAEQLLHAQVEYDLAMARWRAADRKRDEEEQLPLMET